MRHDASSPVNSELFAFVAIKSRVVTWQVKKKRVKERVSLQDELTPKEMIIFNILMTWAKGQLQ